MFVSVQKTNRSADVVEEARAAREQRVRDKRRLEAVVMIQAFVRRCLCVKHLRAECQREFDETFRQYAVQNDTSPTVPVDDVFSMLREFFFMFNTKEDRERFRNVCYYLIASIGSEKPHLNYMSIMQKSESVAVWRRQVIMILKLCVHYLSALNPDSPADARDLVTYSQTIIMLTHASQWKAVKIPNEIVQKVMNNVTIKWLQELVRVGLYPAVRDVLMRGLARTTPTLNKTTFFPLLTLLMRPMVMEAFASETDKQKALISLLSVPGFIVHVETICPVFIETFRKQGVLKMWMELLTSEDVWKVMRENIRTANAALCITANLANIFWLEKSKTNDVDVLHVVSTIIFLLDLCRELNATHQNTTMTKWHAVLGWSSDRVDPCYHDSMQYTTQQLNLIWKREFVKTVFGNSLERKTMNGPVSAKKNDPTPGNFKATALLQRLGLHHLAKTSTKLKLNDGEVSRFAIVSAMYQCAINCLVNLRLHILTGLIVEGRLPMQLWNIVRGIGVGQFVELLKPTPNTYTTEFQLLGLFCNLTSHLIILMDDLELYEEQKIFTINDLLEMSKFLNDLIFRIIWDGLMSSAQMRSDQLFTSAHHLMRILYERDSRRRFAPDDHWIMKEAKGSAFFSELKENHNNVQLLLAFAPHCIPHHDRVKLFRQWIKEDKQSDQDKPTAPILIAVQRRRIVEDGYGHISRLKPEELKGVIRVRFINAEGMAEAGIDQDGVFKEFLEETIKRVFDPNLHLFKTTVDNRIYPSPTSGIQDEHLQLFSFVGRILGKAVYEGIVVDVPLANFFLSQILGHQAANPTYSYFDELPSFDVELSRMLQNLKRYQGKVEELELTFSCDEDRLGQVVSHELMPGGRFVEVTDDNKISYIHLMAHFRMHGQIKQQVNAFTRGFLSIIKPEWISIFSPPELQKLISGDSQTIDLKDLRKNTQYYGGFHSSHRVVGWLWDVLENDFNEEERGLFLKFVTSCSKPPLLGFSYMDPPFSIRCVEVSDDQDSGDTLGSVIRGFFTINRKKISTTRLPTSSTCFNLLKLPNYSKKSVLREKLRYAIRSNAGFELS
ncbi:ubiquitin-protein ligase E3B-like isoform X2 [Paramacrobiotus metropolitanus]|uniref:ubiquitin-protein ligase E3B-like isoform X2 n=1 Tax=Paramacrobiotus metropolitanus TaxID=2943436 RepID=UPI002445AC00|nr:ubiquitin-protein ligase E3B-like isoform X2 [Paramacrobiotus metropolitanus]